MSHAHPTPWTQRAAVGFLVAHCVLIAFSTIALTTFLNGPAPAWLGEEPNATALRLGWKFSGPTYVVLGALAAVLHVTGRLGWWRSLAIFLVASGVALGAELTGTATQLPFGEYQYTTLLGYRIFNLVPFPIPVSWYYMIVGSLVITGRLLAARDDNATRWKWSLLGGLILVAWDVSMDPAMVKTLHWIWGDGDLFVRAGLPAPIVAFFTKDIFYGMPASNWLGWYLTGVIISRLVLQIVPPTVYAEKLSPTHLPVVLYAVNGIMPVALCLRDNLLWGAVLGSLAMAIPVALAVRARARTGLSASAEPMAASLPRPA
jgi:uncharacterized membrane protein